MLNYLIYESLDEFKDKLYSKDKKVAIYGVSSYAEELLSNLNELGVKITCFIDYENYPGTLGGKRFCGFPVEAYNDIRGTIDTIIIGKGDPKLVVSRLSMDFTLFFDLVEINDKVTRWKKTDHPYHENRMLFTTAMIEDAVKRELSKYNIAESLLEEIYMTVRPYTFSPRYLIYFFMLSVLNAIKHRKSGIIAEFGVYKGGASLATLMIQKAIFGKVTIPVYMFDAFTYFPDPSDKDLIDTSILDYQESKETKKLFPDKVEDICYVGEVIDLFKFYGFTDKDFVIKCGWFEDTVADFKSEMEASSKEIVVLRIDSDYYDSMMYCLKNVVPIVQNDSIIILDDYQLYGGAALAVNEYLGLSNIPYRLYNVGQNLTYFYKTELPMF